MCHNVELLKVVKLSGAVMPTLQRIQDIRDELLCDDLEIDYETMKGWTEQRVTAFFENGASHSDLCFEVALG